MRASHKLSQRVASLAVWGRAPARRDGGRDVTLSSHWRKRGRRLERRYERGRSTFSMKNDSIRSYGLRTTSSETTPAPPAQASKSVGTVMDDRPERGELTEPSRPSMCCASRELTAIEPVLYGSVAASRTPGRVGTPEHVRLFPLALLPLALLLLALLPLALLLMALLLLLLLLALLLLLLRQNHRPERWTVVRRWRWTAPSS